MAFLRNIPTLIKVLGSISKLDSASKGIEEARAEALVEALYEYYRKRPELLPAYLLKKEEEGASRDRIVCDFISSMTDRFAISTYQELFIPKTWAIL